MIRVARQMNPDEMSVTSPSEIFQVWLPKNVFASPGW
jgi:hypothetical protein